MAARRAPKRPGRADKLTPETAKRILDAVRAGAPLKQAAEAAGVGESTVYDWRARAQSPKAPAKFADFAADLTRASAEASVAAVAAIRRAMPEDWRAAAFYLERRDPQRWGRRTAVSGELSLQHEVSAEEARERLGALFETLRRRADGEP